jgi:hypothetical protein
LRTPPTANTPGCVERALHQCPVDRRFGKMCAEAGARVGVINLMTLQFETPARLVKSTPLQTRS